MQSANPAVLLVMCSPVELQDLYSVLQVSQSANSEEIRKSYQRLVKEVCWKPWASDSMIMVYNTWQGVSDSLDIELMDY